MNDLVEILKSVAEPTRLRILVALESCELTVSEVCTVLGQSQPRVSRHLGLLSQAGLLSRHAEGTHAYFGLRTDGLGKDVRTAIAPLIDRTDPILQRDKVRLEQVRTQRAEQAAAYFAEVAHEWDELREMDASTTEVEQALLDAVEPPLVNTILDIGTGTGRILELMAPRTKRGVGVDLSRQMLNVARSRIDADELSHCSVRHGDIYDLDIEDDSQDVVVLHHVLHFLVDPASALKAAVRVLAPGGTLLIVDFAAHDHEQLRTEHAHSHLGFEDSEFTKWFQDLKLEATAVTHIGPATKPKDALPAVSLWTGRKPGVTQYPTEVPA